MNHIYFFFQMPEKEWNTFWLLLPRGDRRLEGIPFPRIISGKFTRQLNRRPANWQIHLYRKTKLVCHTSNSNSDYYRKDSTSLLWINLMHGSYLPILEVGTPANRWLWFTINYEYFPLFPHPYFLISD